MPNANLIDITGNKYSHLRVLGLSKCKVGGRIMWDCVCDCGNEKPFMGWNLKANLSKSCSKSCPYNKKNHHLKSDTPEYISYCSMMARCYKPKTNQYKNYGGRGIKVCDRWKRSFNNFFEDMGERPTAKHQLDRIDTNGDYEPSNCRWVTTKENANNRRTNHLLTYKNRTMTISQWADLKDIKYSTLSERIRRGWSIERALNERPEMHHLFR